MADNDNFEVQSVNEKLQSIAQKVHDELPEGSGFVVLAFPFYSEGRLFYASNANRDDVVRVMKEFIQKVNDDTFGKDI